MNGKVTISEIAAAAGVSQAAVSQVLNGNLKKVSRSTGERIILLAETMGYSRLKLSRHVGFVNTVYLTAAEQATYTTFFNDVYYQLQLRSAEAKIELSEVVLTRENYEKTLHSLYDSADVFCTYSSELADKLIQDKKKVVVFQSHRFKGECTRVECDDYAAGKIAAEYALSRNCRSAGTVFWHESDPRFCGFTENFIAGGGTISPINRLIVPANHQEAEAIISRYFLNAAGKLPDIFFCFADNLIFPLLRAAKNAGLKVPEDFGVIGADNLYWGSVNTPAFTTIDLQPGLFAERLIAAVHHVYSGGKPYVENIPVRLLKRETM